MAEIKVSHGLCSPIRPKVLTALEPYEFKDLRIEAWGEGIYGTDDISSYRPDTYRMAACHYANITVSDAAAAWAERLLWQTGQFVLESKPLNPKLQWHAPPACTAGAHGTLGRGTMPTPWRDKKGKAARRRPRQPKQQPAKPAQPKQAKASLLARVIDFFNRV